MRRFFTALIMLAMLGIGILIGSVMTPTARAQTPQPAALNDTTAPSGGITVTTPHPGVDDNYHRGLDHHNPYNGQGSVPYYPDYPLYRWQIYPMQAPNSPPMLFLLDGLSGSSFYLRMDRATNSYFWAAIPRG